MKALHRIQLEIKGQRVQIGDFEEEPPPTLCVFVNYQEHEYRRWLVNDAGKPIHNYKLSVIHELLWHQVDHVKTRGRRVNTYVLNRECAAELEQELIERELGARLGGRRATFRGIPIIVEDSNIRVRMVWEDE